MSGTITGALRTAQSGLLTNQQALDAVANNITNVNTEGYSRKDIKVESRVVSGAGAGVQLSAVKRVIDEGLLKNVRTETGVYEKFSAQSAYFDRMQEMFGSPEGDSTISHMINKFAQSLENLALSPDKSLDKGKWSAGPATWSRPCRT